MAFSSRRVRQKADRLLREGKVRREDAAVYEVQGDTAAYNVIVFHDESVVCTCRYMTHEDRVGLCSHSLAALDIHRSTESERR